MKRCMYIVESLPVACEATDFRKLSNRLLTNEVMQIAYIFFFSCACYRESLARFSYIFLLKRFWFADGRVLISLGSENDIFVSILTWLLFLTLKDLSFVKNDRTSRYLNIVLWSTANTLHDIMSILLTYFF